MGKVYVQTYSFMESFDKPFDNEQIFRQVAAMGYDGVELFGPNLQMDPVELGKLMKELNLEIISMHAPGADQVVDFIPFAKTLNMSYIGIGMEVMRNEDEVHAFAKRLNEIGKACAKEGITVTYHNHTQEFIEYGGKTIEQILMEETDPSCVAFEVDAGWAAAAGADPIALVTEHPGRVQLIHIKESDLVIGPQPPMDFSDIARDENGMPKFSDEQLAEMKREKELNCPAGKGLVDWAALKKAADANGCKGYIVEREFTPAGYASRAEVLKADLDYYRSVME